MFVYNCTIIGSSTCVLVCILISEDHHNLRDDGDPVVEVEDPVVPVVPVDTVLLVVPVVDPVG